MIFLIYDTLRASIDHFSIKMRVSSHSSASSGVTPSCWLADVTRNSRRLLSPALLWVIGLQLVSPTLLAQSPPVREYDESVQRNRMEALLERYGQNKELPTGYELQALLALSHYPELAQTNIRFIVDDVDIPLSSRPWWGSMHRSAKNRRYLVVIDSERAGDRGTLLLKNQPFNAQVGIIGHELAHTVYYLNRSFLGILGDALCQLSSCRIEFERATDRRLIAYGLGWQRYDHALFVRSQLLGSEEAALAAEGGGGAYMSPSELLREMQTLETYAD